MRVLLFGSNGQVGHALQTLPLHTVQWIPVTRRDCDLTDPANIRPLIEQHRPAAIVNAAAYTAVDQAETDLDLCYAVNAVAPVIIGKAARDLDARLIHYSTDYVFDGTSAMPYREEDPTGPRNVYGASKLAGEQALLGLNPDTLILRTSWVYGNHGANFLKTMLRLGAERPELRIVADQHGAPTSAPAIAAATLRILEGTVNDLNETATNAPEQDIPPAHARWVPGIHHMTAAGETTWYGFAQAIFARLAPPSPRPRLVPIPTSEYPTPAARPARSVLANDKFVRSFGFRLPSWEKQLDAVMALREVAG
jgi:dTDP-4-dehydrorhamnose reductase